MTDLDRFAEIVRANSYLIMATADAAGVPWSTPVWFAPDDELWHYVWVSRPGRRHSRNIAERPEIAFSIFDSTQVPGTGRGAYVRATAARVPEPDLERWLAVFNSRDDRLPPWPPETVLPGGSHGLYVATAVEHFVLSDKEERVPVSPPRRT